MQFSLISKFVRRKFCGLLEYCSMSFSLYKNTLILASNISLPELRVTNVISSGPMKKTISWTLTLPGDQAVLKYYASYGASNGKTENLPLSNEARSITVDVEYNTNYIFKIQVETQGGKSKTASTEWLSQSGTPKYNVDIHYCLKIIGMMVQIFV